MTTDWTDQTNQLLKFWSEGQKAWLESLTRAPMGMVSPFAQGASGQDAMRQWNDAWKGSIEQWTSLLQQGSRFALSQDNLRKIVDPAEWAKPAPGSFDFGIEHLIEGPNFATLWDLDRKMLKLQQLGVKRAEDSAAYHAVFGGRINPTASRLVQIHPGPIPDTVSRVPHAVVQPRIRGLIRRLEVHGRAGKLRR